jgi:dTDP-4-amino-4,6-dideoxygalactose transaminase
LPVIQDACQAHGALIGNTPLGSLGTAACYSFYPSKNLGAFGDGGAVVSNCERFAQRVRMLRDYGQRSKSDYAMLGFNSRLDTLQAAVLAIKLQYLEQGNRQRRSIAAKYRELLQDAELVLPGERDGTTHVYHLYVVRHAERDLLRAHLQQQGVQCGIHYPAPIHELEPFREARTVPEGAPLSSRLAKQILSLPMYPDLSDEKIERVASTASSFGNTLAVA